MNQNPKRILIVAATFIGIAVCCQTIFRSTANNVSSTEATKVDRQAGSESSTKNRALDSDSLRWVESIQLCQGISQCQCPECIGMAAEANGNVQTVGWRSDLYSSTEGYAFGYGEDENARWMLGVDGTRQRVLGREPTWQDERLVPWESKSYGEYIGPFRTPHVPEYRLRIGDELEFVFVLSRQRTQQAYELNVGDELQILSSADATLNQPDTLGSRGAGLQILSDGSISLQLIGQVRAEGKTVESLQKELNERYSKFVKKPAIVVQVVKANTRLQDLIESVSAVAGQGGQVRQGIVSPDGTVQLPLLGSVPAIGLTLDEVGREIFARYRMEGLRGVRVTPALLTRASRFVYVLGEVGQPGRFEMNDPTTVIQAIALAQGFNQGANLRNVIVFRRDANWKLVATRLDLSGALFGRRPQPSDEIWLRHSDIVLIPKSPILRLSEQVDLYLSRTAYAIFPQQGVAFNFDDFESL